MTWHCRDETVERLADFSEETQRYLKERIWKTLFEILEDKHDVKIKYTIVPREKEKKREKVEQC